MNTIVDVLRATKIFLALHDLLTYLLLLESLPMQRCQPRGSVTWTLISMMALSGVVKVACVAAGAERGGKREKLFAFAEEARERERKSCRPSSPFYNYMLNVN